MLHDDMFTAFVVSVAWTFADARVLPVWSSVARISASFDGRNKDTLNIVFNVYVMLVLIH